MWIHRLIALLILLGTATSHTAATEEVSEEWKIYRVQEVLYERFFGDSHSTPDGVLGDKTRSAIKEFQDRNNLPVTGHLTESLYRKLADWGVPTDRVWGAISASVDEAYGSAWNHKTRKEAFKAALDGCQKESNYPTKCSTSTTYRAQNNAPGWVAVVHCTVQHKNHIRRGIFPANGSSIKEAKLNAYRWLTDAEFSLRHCKTLLTIAADGSHEK